MTDQDDSRRWENIGMYAGDNAVQHNGDYNVNITNHYAYSLHCRRSLEIDSGERIGAIACIDGLLALAQHLLSELDEYLRLSTLNSPSSPLVPMRNGIFVALQPLNGLKSFLAAPDLRQDRVALISTKQVVASSTHAILLFSESQAVLASLRQSDTLLDNMTQARDKFRELTSKLNWQANVWHMQLEVLASISDNIASATSSGLEVCVARKIQQDQDLEERLATVEEKIARLALQDQQHTEAADQNSTDDTNSGERTSLLEPPPLLESHRMSFDASGFEEILNRSWVYRRNARRSEIWSLHSSIARQSMWSDISKLTAGNVSVLSVIALPVHTSELFDGHWYKSAEIALSGHERHADPDGQAQSSIEMIDGLLEFLTKDQPSVGLVSNTRSTNASNASRSRRKLLSQALGKANEGTSLDKAQDLEGALDAYNDACDILQQVKARTSGEGDKRKLEVLRKMYSDRVEEIWELLKIEPSQHEDTRRARNRLLSVALQQANTAVVLDSAQTLDGANGAIEAYSKARGFLQQAKNRTFRADSKRKNEATRAMYGKRIDELRKMIKDFLDTDDVDNSPARLIADPQVQMEPSPENTNLTDFPQIRQLVDDDASRTDAPSSEPIVAAATLSDTNGGSSKEHIEK